jgi:hypothetical protein
MLWPALVHYSPFTIHNFPALSVVNIPPRSLP